MTRLSVFAFLLAALLSITAVAQTPEKRGASVIAGDARFTVISPSCIRLEWSSDRTFIDQNTFLAIARPAGRDDFTFQVGSGLLTISTGELDLTYRIGSGDFAGSNLKIVVKSTGATWTPGSPRPTNMGGTVSSLNSYKGGAIPTGAGLLTKEGYYVLKDETKLIDTSEWAWYSSRPAGTRRDWYFLGYGKDYRKAFADFISFAGKVPLLPRKALGFWWSKMSCGSEQSVRELFAGFDSRAIPVDMLSFGMQWHINGWTGYAWEKSAYPDPSAMLQWLHGRGLKVFQAHHYGAFLSNEPSFAQVASITGFDGNDTFDFAIKSHAQAFMEYVAEPIEKVGCDYWWLDGYFPGPSGMDGQAWSNHVYMTHMRKTRPDTRQMILSRWGGWGSHRYPVQFSGDVISNWESLKGEVNFTARSGNAMAGYWSHDIGGYKGLGSNARLYARWSQFATFSPVYRYHSSGEERRPWMFGEDAERVVTKFIRLRQQLIPFMYTLAREYHDTGLPLCRPLYIGWPNAAVAYSYESQYAEYMLGKDLLVAPVHSVDDRKGLWFPPDYWTDIFSGANYQGPRADTITVPLDRAPVFARSGCMIPMQPVMAHSSERPLDTMLLKVFPPVAGAPACSSELYEDDGETMAFAAGASARTSLRQAYEGSGSRQTLALHIGASVGQYRGKPSSRTFLFEVYNAATAPSGVTAAGVALPAKTSEAALRTGPGYYYSVNDRRLHICAASVADRSFDVRIEGFTPPAGTVRAGSGMRPAAPGGIHIGSREVKIDDAHTGKLTVKIRSLSGRTVASHTLDAGQAGRISLHGEHERQRARGAVVVAVDDQQRGVVSGTSVGF